MRDAEEECHKIKNNIKAAKFLLREKKKLFLPTYQSLDQHQESPWSPPPRSGKSQKRVWFRPSLHVLYGMPSSKQGVMFYNYMLCFSSGMMFIFCICCRVGQYFVPTYFVRLCESLYFVLYGLNWFIEIVEEMIVCMKWLYNVWFYRYLNRL